MIDTDEKHHVVTIEINGVRQTASVEARKLLVHLLRDDLGLTGTHVGCDTSQCGACTVDIDGKAVKSCTVLAVMADGSRVTTIEGLSPTATTASHRVQKAWQAEDVPQCGYCQSGQIMAAAALLTKTADPSDEQIDQAMTNICRCGTYQRIRAAVHRAAKEA